MTTRYKFLQLSNDNTIISDYDSSTWTLGEWRTQSFEIECCENGFHCSAHILDALNYVKGAILAEVEVAGDCDEDGQGDKEAWQSMRIVKAWHWKKQDSVALAIYAAHLVLSIYEKQYPDDTRPRKAIEAAEAWLKEPSDAAAYAAAAAAAAARAYAAAYAAAAAAAAARADAAADAAAAAAYAYADAADAAAAADIREKINTWLVAHLANMETWQCN